MISKNIRTNGEFYLCPAFNECIANGCTVKIFPCQMHGLGVPEDLELYLVRQKAFIAHRGNWDGPNEARENAPDYIDETHGRFGCDVEVDVWRISGEWFLGHDEPKYRVEEEFLRRPFLWRHAKNGAALASLLQLKLRCFWHQTDDYTVTSTGDVWCYPGSALPTGSIAVMPERTAYTPGELNRCS